MKNRLAELKEVIATLQSCPLRDSSDFFRNFFQWFLSETGADYTVFVTDEIPEPIFTRKSDYPLSRLLREWQDLGGLVRSKSYLHLGEPYRVLELHDEHYPLSVKALALMRGGDSPDLTFWKSFLSLYRKLQYPSMKIEDIRPGSENHSAERDDYTSDPKHNPDRNLSGQEDFILLKGPFPGIYHLADTIAKSDIPVLITGETGTGKEILARRVHGMSGRSEGKFMSINCAALSEDLLEVELFGCKAGSFTDATEDRQGKLSAAAGGTVFLDEIGDMSSGFQSKLLKFIDNGEFYPVGAVVPEKSDIRLICATHKDLSGAMASGNFRSDLYYRISVTRLELPPLREHPENIALLARFFIQKFNQTGRDILLDNESLGMLSRYSWPGNIRQLENVMKRLCALSNPSNDLISQLSDMAEFNDQRERGGKSYKEAVKLFKKRLIRNTLEIYNGNQTHSAQALGLQRTYLIKLIDELGIKNDSEE